MKYEIRQSDPNTQAGTEHGPVFYYLLEIDDEGNQKVLFQHDDLKQVQIHPMVRGQNLKPIPEKDTRGLITE